MALSGHIHSGPKRAPHLSPSNYTSPLSSQIEILYSLPDARIVEFKPTNINKDHVSLNENVTVHIEPGSLSWASRFERTIAVGSLRIYRAPGSVAFLNCQNSIRPILPKSQAWCVDTDSKFVLRSPPLFWRIEIPNTNLVEFQRAQELKRVFSQILRLDKTPCPFSREISIQSTGLSQAPSTRKQKLKPIQRQKSEQSRNVVNLTSQGKLVSEFTVRSISSRTHGPHVCSESPPVYSLQLSKGNEYPCQDNWVPIPRSPSAPNQLSVQNLSIHEKSSSLGDATKQFDPVSLLYLDEPKERLSDELAFIAPTPSGDCPIETIERTEDQAGSPPSESYRRPNIKSNIATTRDSPHLVSVVDDSRSEVSSTESFHSFQSWHSLLESSSPPRSPSQLGVSSQPGLQDKFISSNYSNHAHSISKQNADSEIFPTWDNPINRPLIDKRSSPKLQTPTLYDDRCDKSDDECSEASTSLNVKSSRSILARQSTPIDEFRRRKLPPLSSAVSRQMYRIATQIPSSIIQKTIEVLLSPPSNLFHSMLRIASRITAGEWRGVFSSYGEAVHWDFEDDYREKDEYEVKHKFYLSGSNYPSEISISSLEVD